MISDKNANTMQWLLRREFWEHKGSMFWAPLIVGALLVVLMGGTLAYAITVHGIPEHMMVNVKAVLVPNAVDVPCGSAGFVAGQAF